MPEVKIDPMSLRPYFCSKEIFDYMDKNGFIQKIDGHFVSLNNGVYQCRVLITNKIGNLLCGQ